MITIVVSSPKQPFSVSVFILLRVFYFPLFWSKMCPRTWICFQTQRECQSRNFSKCEYWSEFRVFKNPGIFRSSSKQRRSAWTSHNSPWRPEGWLTISTPVGLLNCSDFSVKQQVTELQVKFSNKLTLFSIHAFNFIFEKAEDFFWQREKCCNVFHALIHTILENNGTLLSCLFSI